MAGIKFDYPGEVLDGAIKPIHSDIGLSAFVESDRLARIDGDRLIKVLDGGGVVPLAEIRGTAIGESSGEFWIELYRLVEIPNGATMNPLGPVSERPVA